MRKGRENAVEKGTRRIERVTWNSQRGAGLDRAMYA